jgi:hypothetical protein
MERHAENNDANALHEVIEYIKIVWIDYGSDKAQKLLDDGLTGEISFRTKTFRKKYFMSEIRVINDTQAIETVAHELGHYLQKLLEQSGIPFESDEEVPFIIEDTIKNLLRKKLYNLK